MIKNLFIAFLIICFPVLGFATTWTTAVTQAGGGGACENGGECSASEFNALMGDYSGSTFNFSGSFTTRIEVVTIYGTSGSPLTLDGYAAGDISPITDCDEGNFTCDGNSNSSAVLLKGIDIGAGLEGPDYITIQDFRMTRDDGDTPTFRIYGDVSEADAEKHCDYLIVQRNFVYESDGTMFYYYSGRNSLVQDNRFFVYGQNSTNATQGVNLIEVDDFVFKNNEVGHDEDGSILGGSAYNSGCTSAEMIELHGVHNALIERNDIYGAANQSGIRPKESFGGNTNLIIRYNKIHHNLGNGTAAGAEHVGYSISIATNLSDINSDIYVYGNYMYGNLRGGLIGPNVHDVHFWSNIISDNGKYGLSISTWDAGGGGSDVPPNNIQFYNNTVSRNNTGGDTDNSRGGLVVINGTNVNIKNNLLWNNRPGGEGSKYNQFYSDITPTSLEHNTYWHDTVSPGGDLFYYDSAVRSLATMKSSYSFEDDAAAGEEVNTAFTNPDGADTTYGTDDDDYSLTGATTVGEDLSGTIATVTIQGTDYVMDHKWGLDPNNTDWTTTPPTVAVVDRDTYGWARGA